jgi:hypothetical protein
MPAALSVTCRFPGTLSNPTERQSAGLQRRRSGMADRQLPRMEA